METMNDFMEQIDASTKKLEVGDLVDGKVLQIDSDNLVVDIKYIQDGVVSDDELENMTSDYAEGEVIKLVVIGFKEEGEVILSQTKALQESGKQILENAEKTGELFEAKLTAIAKGGYRVSVSGIMGYLPFSLYQKGYLENPDEHLGEKTMLAIERSDKRGYVFTRMPYFEKIQLQASQKFYASHNKGDMVKGTLTHFNKGGVVVDVEGLRGFIPRSEVSYSRTAKAEDLVSKGDSLSLVIRELNEKDQSLILSLKDTLSDPWEGIDTKISVGDVYEIKPEGENDNLYFYELAEGVRASLYKDKVNPDMIGEDGLHKVVVANINYDKRRVDLDYFSDEIVYQEEPESEDLGNTLGALFGDQLKSLKFDE